MGYRAALEAAGYDVLAYDSFGSYQGQWVAIVREADGSLGAITDWFGSCSVCDTYEAEFGWDEPTPERLAEFGRRYTSLPIDTEIERLAGHPEDTDHYLSYEDEEILAFLREYKEKLDV